MSTKEHYPEKREESTLLVALHEAKNGTLYIPLVISDGFSVIKWRIPGGGVERGEFSIESACREFKQETGLIATSTYLFSTIEKDSHKKRWKQHRQYVYVAEVKDIKTLQETVLDGNEQLTAKIFPLARVAEYLRSGKRFSRWDILPKHAEILKGVLLKLELL